MPRCDNILRSLGTKFKGIIEIKFLLLPSTSLSIKLAVYTKNIFLQTASDTVNKSNLRQSVKERITFKNPF